MDWLQAIKSLNNALSLCLCTSDGSHRPGASVALIMLSEAYSKVGKENEMIHSAQLAVKYAHNGKSVISDYNLPGLFVGQVSPASAHLRGPVPNRNLFCCRLLHESPTLLASYYNLAVVLESTGPEAESNALEWYMRVISTADKMQQEEAEKDADMNNVEINFQDVAHQIEELKQFSSNARYRLNLKYGQLSVKTRLSSISALSQSPEMDEVTSRIKQNTLQAISVTENNQRSAMADSRMRHQDDTLPPDSRHWDISDAENDLRALYSGIELLTGNKPEQRSLFSRDESMKGSRSKSENLFIGTPHSRFPGQDSNTSIPAFKQKSVSPILLSPSLAKALKNAKQPLSPAAQSRPQSAQPRLLPDTPGSMTLRPTTPVTPPSGNQLAGDSRRKSPDSMERPALLRSVTEPSAVSARGDRLSRMDISLGSLKPSSEKSGPSDSMINKPILSQLQHLKTNEEYCELGKNQLEKTHADRASSKKEGRISSDRASERRASASDAHVRWSVGMEKSAGLARVNPPNNYAGEVMKSAASKTRDLRMLSRTVSDHTFVRAKPPILAASGKIRRKSDVFTTTEFAKAAAAATRQEDFDVNKVEEKKGKASKLRQEMLTVRSRAAVAVQRVFRGYMARKLLYSRRRRGSSSRRRDDFNARDAYQESPQKPVMSIMEAVRMERERAAQATAKIVGIGSNLTVQEPMKRRGSSSSISSIEKKQLVKKKSPVKKRQGGVTGPGLSGVDMDTHTVSATRLSSELKTTDLSVETASSAQTVWKPSRDHDADMKKKLVVGSNIEGRYMAMRLGKKSSWLPGQVRRVHPNGSYDLLYGNGTKEFGVRAEHIRMKVTTPPSSSAVRSRGMNAISQADLMKMHRSAVKLQSVARGYLERRRHRGLLLQIKRCMDLRARERDLNRRETKIWERFESMMSRAREDVARSLRTLKPQRIGRVSDGGSRKNSSTTAGTMDTDYTLSPSSLISSPHIEPLSPVEPFSNEMDESELFSVSVSNDEVPIFPLSIYPIDSIAEETTEN
jgi:uncharacterized UPF0146 family protein